MYFIFRFWSTDEGYGAVDQVGEKISDLSWYKVDFITCLGFEASSVWADPIKGLTRKKVCEAREIFHRL